MSTPGPWTYEWVTFQEPAGLPWAVFGAEREGFAADGLPTPVRDPVADVENEADARLIAAAPDLLAVLEHLMASDTGRGLWTKEFEEQAHAAIAKAKGSA